LDIGFGPDQAMLPAAAVGGARQIQDEIKAGEFRRPRKQSQLELNDGNHQEITPQIKS
jgi:hypothetical protein